MKQNTTRQNAAMSERRWARTGNGRAPMGDAEAACSPSGVGASFSHGEHDGVETKISGVSWLYKNFCGPKAQLFCEKFVASKARFFFGVT